ncbi:MAG: hypothetical protein JST90_03905 [Bacteroidetes bacterium]|nr:hypothetical protein [Bacteroidota bacterium]
MKKNLPFSIPSRLKYDVEMALCAHIYLIDRNIKESYEITKEDLYRYLAAKYVLNQESLQEYLEELVSIPSVYALVVHFKFDLGIAVSDEEAEYYFNWLSLRHQARKAIIRKEILRTVDNEKRINSHYISDYKTLLKIAAEFDQVTFIHWFVCIFLDFERYIHIYVRHVEETKFGNPNNKPRTFFSYKHELIFQLLKKVLLQEEEHIKNHFLEVRIAQSTSGRYGTLSKYLRGKKGRPAIEYNGDKFAIEIEITGRIMSFYQL